MPLRALPLRVALRKESVDRNWLISSVSTAAVASLSARRAWIEIAVQSPAAASPPSLSARRVWIEIERNGKRRGYWHVALRKESVDRNIGASYGRTAKMVSLSARRAWIEIR